MKKNLRFSTFLFFLSFLFLLFSSSCEKSDDKNNLPENTFIDNRDGNVYKTVKIVDQVWMAENLKYLPDVTSPSVSSETNPYYYVYGYSGTNVEDAMALDNYHTYGVLYNWPAANEACPEGWHLPTGDEIAELNLNLGVWTTAGGRLKETGTAHWNIPNTDAMNLHGFTALPGGYMLNNSFNGLNNYGFWWVVQEIDSPFPN